MIIAGFGVSCFRIESKGLSILIDPPREGGGKTVRAHPDLLLITHDHPDHANWALAGDKTVVISTPGEYELNGIPLSGIATFHDKDGGKTLGRNTVFIFELEGLRLAHLGDLADRKHIARANESTSSLEEAIKPCDILFIPCGGKTVLGPSEAAELARAIKPKLVIPMHAASFAPLATALGAKLERMERLVFRPSELPPEGMRLVALMPGAHE